MTDNEYIPEAALLPHIRMARLYDTEGLNIHGKTKLRTADCFELSLFIKNGGSVTQNGETREIEAGLLRFLRPGGEICSVPPYQCLTIYFSFGDTEYTQNELLALIPAFQTGGERFEQLFRHIIESCSQQTPGHTALANGLLLQLIAYASNTLNPGESYGKTTKLCIKHMEKHISEKVTLDDLGSLTGYSALHTLRLFKQDTGMSPHEYAEMLRMDKARLLLADTSVPIKEISELCGYANPEYFNSAFKKANGTTPGKYRRRARLL